MVIKNEKNYIFYRFSSPELPFAPGMSCLSAEKMKKKIRERSIALGNNIKRGLLLQYVNY